MIYRTVFDVFIRAICVWATLLLAAPRVAVAAQTQVVDADFMTILESRTGVLSVWRYSGNTDVYVFDFPSLTQQARTFNRITQLTEQQISEPYPRVLTTPEIERYIDSLHRSQANFAFGHDIMVQELAQFFNLVERDKVALNPEEYELRDFLLERGLLRVWRGIYQALRPTAVLLSIPQKQEAHDGEPRITEDARYTIFLHEISHAEFYSNPYYAAYVRKFWSDSLIEEQRGAFRKFLEKYNYGTGSDELLVNEMQAYLMFTPDAASFSAAKLGVSESELKEMQEAFRNGKPPTRLPLRWLRGG